LNLAVLATLASLNSLESCTTGIGSAESERKPWAMR
jgi:hypothetical protein